MLNVLKKWSTYLFPGLFSLLLWTLNVNDAISKADLPPPSSHQSVLSQHSQDDMMTCPVVSELHKKRSQDNSENRVWFAPGGWLSYSPSFATQLEGPIMVVWIGVQWGELVCSYRGTGVFPVFLHYNLLVNQPQPDRHWRSSPHALHTWVCLINNNPANCSFKPRQQDKQDSIHKQLQGLERVGPH